MFRDNSGTGRSWLAIAISTSRSCLGYAGGCRASYRSAPAVDREDGAVDETRAITCQEGDSLGSGGPPCGGLRGVLVERFTHHNGALGAGRSRSDRVHPHTAGTVFGR